MSLAEEKDAARSAAFERRKGGTCRCRARFVRRTFCISGGLSRRALAGYLPIRTEIDPLPAMAEAAAYGPVGVPVIQGAGQPLKFRAWEPDCALTDGPFNVQVPAAGDWVEPEILIVPLVAFTSDRQRLGYGGGFYDRTLAQLREKRGILAVGFAYAAQEAEFLPVEPTDQSLDLIITENGVIRP